MDIIFLTCKDKDEADKIRNSLLDQKLVVCTKITNVSWAYLWQGKKENANEVLLIMETKSGLLEKIESEVKKLHSYKTFTMFAWDVKYMSAGMWEWMQEELG